MRIAGGLHKGLLADEGVRLVQLDAALSAQFDQGDASLVEPACIGGKGYRLVLYCGVDVNHGQLSDSDRLSGQAGLHRKTQVRIPAIVTADSGRS